MEKLTLATKNHRGTWFGVLVSPQRGMLASSLSTKKTALTEHLRAAAMGVPIHKSAEGAIALNYMLRLFDGKPTTPNLRFDWETVTGFQQKICELMREIPKGRVTTYGIMATHIGSGPRAVGTAVGRNPWPLFVPCHRVVPATLEVGNYSIGGSLSDYGCEVKRGLLEREGAPMKNGKIDSKALWTPAEA